MAFPLPKEGNYDRWCFCLSLNYSHTIRLILGKISTQFDLSENDLYILSLESHKTKDNICYFENYFFIDFVQDFTENKTFDFKINIINNKVDGIIHYKNIKFQDEIYLLTVHHPLLVETYQNYYPIINNIIQLLIKL